MPDEISGMGKTNGNASLIMQEMFFLAVVYTVDNTVLFARSK
jgi:hypothetical protein